MCRSDPGHSSAARAGLAVAQPQLSLSDVLVCSLVGSCRSPAGAMRPRPSLGPFLEALLVAVWPRATGWQRAAA